MTRQHCLLAGRRIMKSPGRGDQHDRLTLSGRSIGNVFDIGPSGSLRLFARAQTSRPSAHTLNCLKEKALSGSRCCTVCAGIQVLEAREQEEAE